MEKCSHFSMTFLLILHAANAATEMKRQRNRGAQLIAADCDYACGECRDRDEASAGIQKLLYLSRDDLHQPLSCLDRCPGNVRCDEKPVLIFYIQQRAVLCHRLG